MTNGHILVLQTKRRKTMNFDERQTIALETIAKYIPWIAFSLMIPVGYLIGVALEKWL